MSEKNPERRSLTSKRLKIILGVCVFLLLISIVYRFLEIDPLFPEDKKQVPVAQAANDVLVKRQISFASSDVNAVDYDLTAFVSANTFSATIKSFIGKVDTTKKRYRSFADLDGRAKAEQAFRYRISEAEGLSAFVYFLLISLTTLVSEDLAAIGAGVLAANGQLSLSVAIAASFFGIYVGDLLLFLLGRWFGAKALRRAPVRWLVSEASVIRAADWFEKRGAIAILLSRFTPSFRLPTYVSAGMFGMSFLKFAVVSGIAVAIWTPILVVAAAWLGDETITRLFLESQGAIWKIFLSFLGLYFLIKFIFRLTTWKGRRLFIGKLKRVTEWEFWPVHIFYIPVVVYVIRLAVKHRSLTVFTCSNPSIPAGGLIGESKDAIYRLINGSASAGEFTLKHSLIRGTVSAAEKVRRIHEFIADNQLSFPVVLKPDVGERGKGVAIARSDEEIDHYLLGSESDIIVHEFFDGVEASVFYYRYPDEPTGKIFSITEKRFPCVTGDGISTLNELILNDDRAVALAAKYFKHNEQRLNDIPAQGVAVQLIDIGTHSRGAIFADGEWLRTEKLERAIDQICQGIKGFYFGRFDLRAKTFDDFRNGGPFKIIELNGVSSESTNIYDPRFSLFDAYAILFRQWRIAFEIGSANRAAGCLPTACRDLLRMIFGKSDDGKKPASILRDNPGTLN